MLHVLVGQVPRGPYGSAQASYELNIKAFWCPLPGQEFDPSILFQAAPAAGVLPHSGRAGAQGEGPRRRPRRGRGRSLDNMRQF